MLTLHLSIAPIRRSLFIALGLVAGCGGGSGDTSSSGTSTGSESSASGGPTTSSTGDISASTGAPTSGVSGTGTATTTGGETTTTGTATTVDTSGVSATEATSSGTTDATTGGPGESSGSTSAPETTGGGDCTPLLQGGTNPPAPSGWEKCGNDLPHRVDALECLVQETSTPCVDMQPENQCNSDADCKDMPFGTCNQFNNLLIFCGCVYGCQTDDDCAAGQVCRCGGDGLGAYTTCVASTCTSDADCEGGEVCQFAQKAGEDCPFEVIDGHCTTPDDTCNSDADCGPPGCGFSEGKWQCANLICGRPFVVEDVAVTAAPTGREDWRALVGCVAAAPELAARLAEHWTTAGLYEHASVASFARFVLQLLAVGAPPALVLAANQALADEVEHARVCFALASLYEGTGVGPGPLPQAHDAGVTGLAAITAAVIREACVGETLSALEIREAAARAEDPGLRRLLTTIADDEQRHAELGWRFVQWALAQMDADGRAQAAAAFDAAIAGAEAEAERLAGEASAPALRAHGVVDAPLRGTVWRTGLAALVRPSAAALAGLQVAC